MDDECIGEIRTAGLRRCPRYVFRADFVHEATMTGGEACVDKNRQESFFGDSGGEGERAAGERRSVR